jgi:predicted DNA-binding transcriptional regulator YafY
VDLEQRGATTLGHLVEAQGGRIGLPRREAVSLPPQIEEALGCGGDLRLRYVSALGEETLRVVTPLFVTPHGGYLYLVAECHLRKEQRSFRLDRILEMEIRGDSERGERIAG